MDSKDDDDEQRQEALMALVSHGICATMDEAASLSEEQLAVALAYLRALYKQSRDEE